MRIAVISASTRADTEVAAWVTAIQTQITRDFAPRWGFPAELGFVPHGQKPPRGVPWLAVLDDADVANALGYHDVTPEGLPMGKVFVRKAESDGVPPSAVASHETLEMLPDGNVNLLVQDANDPTLLWAYEDSDAVQAQSYDINGVTVSNFVFPSYFQSYLTSGPFDFLQSLRGPLPEVAPGGYMAYVKNGTWGQIFGSAPPGQSSPAFRWRARPHAGSRRLRRILNSRVPSTVEMA